MLTRELAIVDYENGQVLPDRLIRRDKRDLDVFENRSVSGHDRGGTAVVAHAIRSLARLECDRICGGRH